MKFSVSTQNRLKAIRKCHNCYTTLKNKKKYIPYPRNTVIHQKGGTAVYFGVAKECVRCGFLNEPRDTVVV